MEDVKESEDGKLGVKENRDITDAKKGADQQSNGTDKTEEAPSSVPAPAENMAEAPCFEIDQATLDWVQKRRAELAKVRIDPVYQAAEKEREADLTKYLTVLHRKFVKPGATVGSYEMLPVLSKEGKPKIAEDVDWIEEELAVLTKYEKGEIDIRYGPPFPNNKYEEQTYEEWYGSPIDFWKGKWFWEQPWYQGQKHYSAKPSDPALRSSRNFYELSKAMATAPSHTPKIGNDPAKQKEYRDILRLVIQSSDYDRLYALESLLRRFARYDREEGLLKSGPGEEPIALVAVWRSDKDKADCWGVRSAKEISQGIVKMLADDYADFD